MGAAVPLTKSTNALEVGDTSTAIVEIEKSFELLDRWRPAYAIQAALSYLKAGQPDTAANYLKQWLIRDGESAYLWEIAGDCFLDKEELDRAEAAWKRGQLVRASNGTG